MSGSTRRYRARQLHQPDGWLSPGYVEVDERGFVASVAGSVSAGWEDAEVEQLDGFVVPGMVNIHSHVHQRGLSGRSEPGTDSTVEESFWTWRTRMYDFANRLS